MKFQAKVIASGNATAVALPEDVVLALGPQSRPAITININGCRWRSRVAAMRGQRLIGISAAHRSAAGIAEGDMVDVEVDLDEAPRTVEPPSDLLDAFNGQSSTHTAYETLPFGLKTKYVSAIVDAKTTLVRQRRIAKLVSMLQDR